MFKEMGGAASWLGGGLAGGDVWRFPLDSVHRAELLAGPDLGTLRPVLARLSREVLTRRGFALLQGVRVESLPESELDTLAVRIASGVGVVVPPVVHVRDQG